MEFKNNNLKFKASFLSKALSSKPLIDVIPCGTTCVYHGYRRVRAAPQLGEV
jgi:hypothetical protein